MTMSKSPKRTKAHRAPAGFKKQKERSSGAQQTVPVSPGPVAQGGNRARFPFVTCDRVFLGLILLFVVVVRLRLLGFPLERDEGEYAYMGQLIQQGIPPYSLAYSMKLPGTYFMYALNMALFGQTIAGVHLGLMVMNCATLLILYKLGAKILNSFAGILAAYTYAFLSLSPSVLGFAGHATHFVAFWAMAGLFVLLHALEKDTWPLYFVAGVLLSLAFIMKQPGIFFTLFGAAYILVHSFRGGNITLKRGVFNLGVFLCATLFPLAVMMGYLYASGVFNKFWFFTVVYSLKYGSQIPLSGAVDSFMHRFPGVVDGFFLLWGLSALGFISLFFHPGLRNKRILVILFVACSFLTVCPGFYFRKHYFITLLPAVSLLVGIFADYVRVRCAMLLRAASSHSKQWTAMGVPVALFALAAIIGVAHQSDYLFSEDPNSLCRKIYGANPFPESVEIARFIKRHTTAADKIAVIGSEPQIYFYSGRHSATGYIYTYGLMEIHDYSLAMQKEMAAEIEGSKPRFIVFVNVASSWLTRPESERFIFGWAEAYLRENYDLVGTVDIVAADHTVYKWYDEAWHYTPRSAASLLVFQRR
jgi:hypothetical protein